MITIDGRELAFHEGETVLACALRNGIDIPHFCSHPSLPPFGACRMCLVEIEGMRGYPPSCATAAVEGMVVQTNTQKLQDLRRNILGLIMLEHPNACLVCGKRELCNQFRPSAEKSGHTTGCQTCNNKATCKVRVLSNDLGLTDLPVPPTYHFRPLERSEPFIDRDLNLCILCGRCVGICKHQQGTAIIDFVGRSSRTHIGEAFGKSLGEAGCRYCGSCIDVCPTGTLSDRFAKWHGAPDATTATTCIFCGEACALTAASAKGMLTATRAVDEDKPLCVLGRFAVAEFLSGAARLQEPHIRVGEVLRQVDWEQAIAAMAEKLAAHTGGKFALVCDTTSPCEDRHVFKRFTEEVMGSKHYIEIQPDARGVSKAALPDGVKAAIVMGGFVDTAELKALDLLIVQDCYPTSASEMADAVFPAAVFAETAGTILDGQGTPRPLRQAAKAPGQARAEWAIVQELAAAMGNKDLAYDSLEAIGQDLGLDAKLNLNREAAPEAALDPKLRRTFFRGHRISDVVTGLRRLPMDGEAPLVAEDTETAVAPVEAEGGFEILSTQEIAPNTHEIVVHAPEIAKKALAGQFAIVMVDETSERVPYTLADWDTEAGTVTFVVLEKGQSSRKLILKDQGSHLAHVVGPLGIPLEIKNYGTVVLAGGCYGIGAIGPIAKAMKAAGNHVIAVAEARSHYLAYHGAKLAGLADEFVQTTIDGSMGIQGHAIDVIKERLGAGKQTDLIIAVGCPFMMMLTAKETRESGVKTLAALNPIMLDGTGMCGACRVSVGEDTKFACVDGPFFDAHLVDWDEVRDRRQAYSHEEIQSVGKSEPVTLLHEYTGHTGHTCSCH